MSKISRDRSSTYNSRILMLRTVTPRDSSRDISLSRLFYSSHFRTFPPFPHIVFLRTSPYLSALLRVSLSFPFLAFPCFTIIILLSIPSLTCVSFSLSFTLPFRTVPWLLRYSLCNPYIHTRY